MGRITLEQANRIAAAAIDKGAALGLKPLTVAVLDGDGQPIVLQRQDGAAPLRPRIAVAKASGALGLGMSTRAIADIASERPAFFGSLVALAPEGLVPAAGGVIVADAHGVAIGAVGVTGDTSDNDEICALAGIAASGLSTPVASSGR